MKWLKLTPKAGLSLLINCAMIEFFVEQPECGGKLETDKQSPGLFRLRLNQQSRALLAESVS